MKTTNKNHIDLNIKWLVLIFFFTGLLISCSNGSDDEGFASIYSGTGNFNFTGDYNMTFSGTAKNVQITQTNGQESIPISFIDNQGKEFFIGLRSAPLEARAYNMKTLGDEGYSAIIFEGNIYDSGAIGGKGFLNISTLNKKSIKGSADMRLARPLNTADTVVVKGSFELIGQ